MFFPRVYFYSIEVLSLDSLLPSCIQDLHTQHSQLVPWEQRLVSAQNVLFNEELFAQVTDFKCSNFFVITCMSLSMSLHCYCLNFFVNICYYLYYLYFLVNTYVFVFYFLLFVVITNKIQLQILKQKHVQSKNINKFKFFCSVYKILIVHHTAAALR